MATITRAEQFGLRAVVGDRTVDVPDEPTFEVELDLMTDSESGEQYYELEFELSWSK